MDKVIVKFWVDREVPSSKTRSFCNLTLEVEGAQDVFGREKFFTLPVFEPEISPNGYEGTWEGFGMPVRSYKIVHDFTSKDWQDDFEIREKEQEFQGNKYLYLRVLHDCRDVNMEIG